MDLFCARQGRCQLLHAISETWFPPGIIFAQDDPLYFKKLQLHAFVRLEAKNGAR